MTLKEVINVLKEKKREADEAYEDYGADLYDECCIAEASKSNTLEDVIKLLEEVEV